jgi:regulator of protease activity HflC (stomatin/prohibitin superfamily)
MKDNQKAITKDNVTIDIDGVLYIKIKDAEKASYGVDDSEFAIKQLAQVPNFSQE